MKRINARIKQPKIKEIRYQNYSIKIDLNNIIEIDGFIPIMSYKELEDNNYEVYTGVINKNFEVVVPIRREILSKSKLLDDELTINLMLFKSGNLIYQCSDNCYLIDLNNVRFNNEVPNNYILKFLAYYNIGNGSIIVYNKDNSYIYDVYNKKEKGLIYDYIKPSNTFKDLYEAYFSKKENDVVTLSMSLLMNDDGIPADEIIVNNILKVYPLYEMYDEKQKLINYCDECYDLFLSQNGALCKKVN